MTLKIPDQIRADFPILSTTMNGKPLIYFDNGATTQKPQSVIDAIVRYYQQDNANVHRGLYELSQRATDSYEQARSRVANFLGGVHTEETIFTRGTTEAINLVAYSWARSQLGSGDEILLTGLEHHSNIVPWQMACEATGSRLRVVQPEPDGHLDLQKVALSISNRTRLVAVQHISNALGIIHDIKAIIGLAKKVGALVLVDGAQSVAHQPTDVRELDCDFFAFSGHKLYGPTGIGVLWGRRELLANMPPFMGGGDMIESVAFQQTSYAGLPNRFEAGTPHIAGAVGLAAAIDYVEKLGWSNIAQAEQRLLDRLNERLRSIAGLRILGDCRPKTAIVSFVIDTPAIATLDIANYLGLEGIAVRTGHHCCMPLMSHLGVTGTCRASLAIYNTVDEIDRFATAIQALIDSRQQTSSSHPKSPSHTISTNQAHSSDQSQSSSQLPNENSQTAELLFARAAGSSPASVAEQLIEEFLSFDDTDSKTRLLLELGQELPNQFQILKQLTGNVPGCMSEVYLLGRSCAEQPDKLEFSGDSNAQIVRGLIAILQQLFSGQDAQAVLEFDLEAFFRKIGLDQFITSQRRSGLAGMVQRLRKLAETVSQAEV